MPTFQSVPLHPAIRQRLNEASLPITTPQALLTRTPVALQEALSGNRSSAHPKIDLAQVQQLRVQVAQSILKSQNITIDRSAADLVEQLPRHTLSTGCPALDDFLMYPAEEWMLPQGLPQGTLLSIVGPPGSGKTQIGLQMALHAALDATSKQYDIAGAGETAATTTTNPAPRRIRYVATTAGAVVADLSWRCRSLLESREESLDMPLPVDILPDPQTPPTKRRKKRKMPENLFFQSITTITDLRLALHDVEEGELIVVDSLSSLVDLEYPQDLPFLLQSLKWETRRHSLWMVLIGGRMMEESLRKASDIQLSLEPKTSFQDEDDHPLLSVKASLTKHVGQVTEGKDPKSIALTLTTGGWVPTGSHASRPAT